MKAREIRDRARRRGLAPPPNITGSEWANRFRRLSSEASAEYGRFRIERTPYMREILDVMTGAAVDVEEVWFMKSAQIAYSENLNNVIGYHIHLDPGPMMMVQPTVEMAESYSKDRIEPMLRDCPELAALTGYGEKNGSTIQAKHFPGGRLVMIGANSPASIASRPIRIVLADEVDRMPHSTGKEGDPIELARARQATFESNRMFIAGGTPVLKDASRTAKGFEATDKRKYHVPCPHCEKLFPLEWENLQHDPQKDHYAEFQCTECDEWVEHHHKASMIADEAMVGKARWMATDEAPRDRRGFFIWTAYSPFRSWRWICDQWQRAKGDPEMEQVFYNTVLGRPYSFGAQELDHQRLFERREDYNTTDAIPDDVLVITAGGDTQDDRFELEVVGWGDGEESWSLDYVTIHGDPNNRNTRAQLEEYLRETTFKRKDGREMHIKAVFLDAGGHRADAVYSFCRGKTARHVFPCRGLTTAGQPIFARFSILKKQRVRLAHVGTDTAKETIYARLSNPEESAGRMHFPMAYSVDYFKQLTAEEKVIRWSGGRPTVRFEKKKEGGQRNEPLDVRVYALSALRSLPLNLRTMARRNRAMKKREAEKSEEPAKPVKQAKPAPKTKKKTPTPRRKATRRRGWASVR